MSKKPRAARTLLSLCLLAPMCSADISGTPAVQAFIRQVSKQSGYPPQDLQRIFAQVDIQEKVLDAMSKPYEAKPWHQYRKLFLTEARIQGGLSFWSSNSAALDNANRRYGVEPEIIVAIIGIETSYGQNTGNYRVIDALSTLAFAYPKRAEFFRKELANFLTLTRKEAMDPLLPKGSYAGAMGLPQFMPSSYLAYAVDLDGDMKRNIWSNPADAIGSVANYFAHSGWIKGEPVAYAATATETTDTPSSKDIRPSQTIGQIKAGGVRIQGANVPSSTPARLFSLSGENGTELWVGLQNLYAITRYNHSPLYAMAAFQLSRELLCRHAHLATDCR